jgi:hemoglobin-like flavoprotein
MTPADLALIQSDAAVFTERPDEYARAFYATLFELAPESRGLFPDDMAAQRTKLTDELRVLLDAADVLRTGAPLAEFATRARDLGRRHRDYGVTAAAYAPVGVALVAALRETVIGFDDEHAAAWQRLYQVVADTMREGALDPAG